MIEVKIKIKCDRCGYGEKDNLDANSPLTVKQEVDEFIVDLDYRKQFDGTIYCPDCDGETG